MTDIVVASGETFSGIVNAGDQLTVDAGGATNGAMIYGTEILNQGATSSNDTIEAGGTLTGGGIASPISNITIAGGNLADNSSPLENGVDFSTTGGVLEIVGSLPSNVTTPITGFKAGDGITFPNAQLLGASLSVEGDDVTVTAGEVPDSATHQFDIVGASLANLFLYDQITTPGDELDDLLTLTCFLAGTAITTPDGFRAIETLQAGDLVLTADGEAMPVRWLGRQTVATRFADPHRVAPICIRAGAFDENLPARDLFVSPDHALMVDGVFVQAGALVNGVSITREDRFTPATLVYFHVELFSHTLILAEGVAAESFIDNVDRLAFDNWDEHGAPEASMLEMAHARAKSYRQVPRALHTRLLARSFDLVAESISAVA